VTASSSSLTIAVVGGGLSGLVLARVLQQQNIACTVYELDATADARRQGGLLDLHVDSGQLALREAGLYEQFRRLTVPQAEAMRVMDKAGTVFIDQASDDSAGNSARQPRCPPRPPSSAPEACSHCRTTRISAGTEAATCI
jgi:2-polyprenyl-6-methoxyphenol hydroxylase-like FAD-dependent oxidoreductase